MKHTRKESWKQSNNTYWEICLRIHWKLSRHRHASLWTETFTFCDKLTQYLPHTTLKPTCHYWEPCSYCFSYWPTQILIWALFVFAFLPAVNEHVTFRFSLYLLKSSSFSFYAYIHCYFSLFFWKKKTQFNNIYEIIKLWRF